MEQIITSLLENDLYKVNMAQVALHQFPTYRTRWAFTCRTPGVKFTSEMVKEIERQLSMYSELRFSVSELSWLRWRCPWLTYDFIDYLKKWAPDMSEITVTEDPSVPCHMTIEANGTWLSTMMYEMPVLAIVNEVYFAYKYGEGALEDRFKRRARAKVKGLKEGKWRLGAFSEFGLRRRYSGKMQDWLVKSLVRADLPEFVGTSNMALAMKYGIKAVGTMAHEFIMCAGQGDLSRNPAYCNRFAMEAWRKEFGVQNGIYLTDLIGDDMFLKDFNLEYATLFSGLRHDSGDPVAWGNRMLDHYISLGISPKTKTLLFSDSLDFDRASALYRRFDGLAKVAFGIGTWLSNDTGEEPLNIVFKVKEVNGMPACKLSNVVGKTMCPDPEYAEYLTRCIDWRKKTERS